MTGPGQGHDGEITGETRMRAAIARARAARMPPEEIADRVAGALTSPHDRADMSPAQIRGLAASAITQAQQVAFLLGRLAELLDDPGEGEGA
jgi:hypothetical protein